MKKSIFLILTTILVFSDSCAVPKNKGIQVRFETTSGDITVQLYAETAKHQDNFMKLVNVGFYNGVLFHRVIAGFMIQAGDPDSKKAKAGTSLGSGDMGYTIPAELKYPNCYHKRGALSAARQSDASNPLKVSSGCQFYIVTGKVFSESSLDSMENSNKMKLEVKLFQNIVKSKQVEIAKYNKERNQSKLDKLRDSILAIVHIDMEKTKSYKFTPQQRNDYKTIGGTPHLDGEYTVFGEVTQGMDIVEKISKSKTDLNDRPLIDVRVMKATIIKQRKNASTVM